ncbi:hypothetical protein C1H46_034097 [Malus baccata]|uniref:Exportin-T n=1 Tax=Malus baccata TaxID=106549 RepID=A0A540L1I0_MALBA|nr:hypothetical protein C1H46_034097 [Malus baccata]
MQLLLFTSCKHKDILVRKACVQIFIRLIKDWCAMPNGEEKVPGFQSFIIETFATNCCLYSLLDTSFEFRDANTLVLFGEIVLAQKVMFEKFGNDFLAHFVSKGFPAAHCPQDLAEKYCQQLQLVLFGEIVLAQKVMFEKFGNDFLAHFVSKGFPAAHCPQDLAEKYCQQLQGSDIKALKSFYQSLIESLRRQQNGSLVVR